MLCLKLKLAKKSSEHEELSSFRIGNDISVQLIEKRGSWIVVGITAPKDVAIVRESVYQKVLSEKIEQMRTEPEQRRTDGHTTTP